jgi:hypothetical protein
VAAPMWDRIARREQICRSAQNPPDFAAVEMDTRLSAARVDMQARELQLRVNKMRKEKKRQMSQLLTQVMSADATATPPQRRDRSRGSAPLPRQSFAGSSSAALPTPRHGSIDPNTI